MTRMLDESGSRVPSEAGNGLGSVGTSGANVLSATEALQLIRRRELSAAELVQACLRQIERLEPVLRAWTHVARDAATATASACDADFARGDFRGALSGIPVGVKDIFNTYDMPTAMGSPIWAGFSPGNDARVVSELRLNGAIVLGKTVTAEFAVHTPGDTRNPHNPEYMPGTSSSGSAAAVAACMVPLALGTQTAGSTIRPASYCGVYGFKPSFGLVPRTGSLKTTDSLDTVAWFARTVSDLELLFDVLRVKGSDYPVSDAALADPARQKAPGAPWRVALVKGPRWDDAEPYAREALLHLGERLAALPDVIVEHADVPSSLDEAHDVHAVIYDKALSYYFRDEFKEDTLISPIMKGLIEHGQQVTRERYVAALARQTELARDIDRWFFTQPHDIVLTLSTGGEALKGLTSTDRPDNCLIWTLCGLPAINVPLFVGPSGLPFGAQILARRYNDRQALAFSHLLCRTGVAPEGTHPRPALDWRV